MLKKKVLPKLFQVPFVKALASHRASPQKPPQPCVAAYGTGVSPSSKVVSTSAKILAGAEGVWCSKEEFEEQKTFALQNIRCLNNYSCISIGVTFMTIIYNACDSITY